MHLRWERASTHEGDHVWPLDVPLLLRVQVETHSGWLATISSIHKTADAQQLNSEVLEIVKKEAFRPSIRLLRIQWS
jgi:hypothetical protein